MNFQRRLFLLLAGIIFATTPVLAQSAAPVRSYQQMTLSERKGFVAQQARSIARKLSGTEYEFTPEFEKEIQQAVETYAARIGNDGGDRLWKGDARFVFERGQTYAPTLINAFRAQGVSPLMGLYIPLVESEYVNLQTPNSVGAIGLFQFLPKTGERFGLTTQELLDVEKSADAAARYLAKNLALFRGDKMKEALALLAYNRGEKAVTQDLALLVNERNSSCSICALTSQRDKLDSTFQTENVYYVPRFFAAAIIGENPQAFGLQLQPLSSYELKR
jgi:soluble lytic murein transglycosylase-like protein